jgi:hypothetical protein
LLPLLLLLADLDILHVNIIDLSLTDLSLT